MNLSPRFAAYTLHRTFDRREPLWVRSLELEHIAAELPRPLVLVNGAFDLLHSSHMRLIFAARKRARTLVCALDTDEKIRASKGPRRPIQSFVERATTLHYMPIDLIVPIGGAEDMDRLIKVLRPNVRFQGDQYRDYPSRYKTPKVFIYTGRASTSELEHRIIHKYEVTKSEEAACIP